ncbi:holin [Stenotrophomonas acidaminiphila]|jgi:ABC-type proline/glycine betaine transport system permease subunit|uniref:holin n=1 Tax=Stenotrophomonas acidaminiphila TaxID=128780 RepID=UPI0015F808E0|nr:holin [Stenotrophomonas acidaminiphila]
MKDQAAEATIAAVAQKVAYGGGVAFFGGLTANEIAAFGGLFIAFLGLLVQVYFKVLDNRRKSELHKLMLSGRRFDPVQGDSDD